MKEGTDLRKLDEIDLDELREGLKLLKSTGERRSFRNKAGFLCPACQKEFDVVMESRKEHNRFGSTGSARFCVTRQDRRIFVFTHK